MVVSYLSMPASPELSAPVTDPVADPVAEPAAEPAAEPVAKPVAKPVAEPVAEPVPTLAAPEKPPPAPLDPSPPTHEHVAPNPSPPTKLPESQADRVSQDITPPASDAPMPTSPATDGAAQVDVQLRGDVDRVWLQSKSGHFPVGKVPPGTYTVLAFFDGVNPTSTQTVSLLPGKQYVLTCSDSMMVCKLVTR